MQSPLDGMQGEESPMFRDVYETSPQSDYQPTQTAFPLPPSAFPPSTYNPYQPSQFQTKLHDQSNHQQQQQPNNLFSPRKQQIYPSTLSRLPAFLRKSESQSFYPSGHSTNQNPNPYPITPLFPIVGNGNGSGSAGLVGGGGESYFAQQQQQAQQPHPTTNFEQNIDFQSQASFSTPQRPTTNRDRDRPTSNPNLIAGQNNNSKQFESLESLLSRAGYKDTRVFTPEAEKLKERKLAIAMGMGMGMGMGPMEQMGMGMAMGTQSQGYGQENVPIQMHLNGGTTMGYNAQGIGSQGQGQGSRQAQPTSAVPLHPSLPPKPIAYRAMSNQDLRRGGRGGGRGGRGGGGRQHQLGQALGNNRGQAQNAVGGAYGQLHQYQQVPSPLPQQQQEFHLQRPPPRKMPSAFHLNEGSVERAVDFGLFNPHNQIQQGYPSPFALPPLHTTYYSPIAPFQPPEYVTDTTPALPPPPNHRPTPYATNPSIYAQKPQQQEINGYSKAFDAMYANAEPVTVTQSERPALSPRAESYAGSEPGSGEGSVIGVIGMTESGTPVTGRKRKVLNRVEIETVEPEVKEVDFGENTRMEVEKVDKVEHSWASMEDDEDEEDYTGGAHWWRRDLETVSAKGVSANAPEPITAPEMHRQASSQEVEEVERNLISLQQSTQSTIQDRRSASITTLPEESFDPTAYEASSPEDEDFADVHDESGVTEPDEVYDSFVGISSGGKEVTVDGLAEAAFEETREEIDPHRATVVTPPRPTRSSTLSPVRLSALVSPPRISPASTKTEAVRENGILQPDQSCERQLKHAISTPMFAKESDKAVITAENGAIRDPGWGIGIGLGLGNPTGWLKSVGRAWSGGSASSSQSGGSQETMKASGSEINAQAPDLKAVKESVAPIAKQRAPKAMKSMGNLRRKPASPRLDKTARIVCDSSSPDELPPIDMHEPTVVSAMSRRPLRAKLSLQNLRPSRSPVESEAITSPTLSPRADWHDSFWGPAAMKPIGFNATHTPGTPGKKAYYRSNSDSVSLGGYPDFSQSFFYSPPTPPKAPGSEVIPPTANPGRMVKKQHSIKSLRAHLLKGAVVAKQAAAAQAATPPVPDLPDAFKHMSNMVKSAPKPIKPFPEPPVFAISSPGMCDAGLPPRELVLEGEEWEGGSSYESAKQRERARSQGKGKMKRSNSQKKQRAV